MGQLDRLEEVENRVGEGAGPRSADVRVEWRDADPEGRPTGMEWDADERRVAYDFSAKQHEVLAAAESGKNDIVAYLGGYRSGKTVLSTRWLLTQALRHPGERFLLMGIDFSKARASTFRVLFEQLPGERTAIVTKGFNGPESSPVVTDYNRSENRLTLVNDATILLGSADDWARYAGAEFGGVVLDEPSHYDDLHDILEMVGSRLTAKTGPKCMVWSLTGNGFNAAWEVLEQRQDSDGSPLALDIEVIRASIEDNPYLDADDKERLRRQFMGTGREAQAIEGGFSAAQGLVYQSFDRETHVVDHGELMDAVHGDRRVYGYDAGWRDPRVVVEAAMTHYGQLAVVDLFYEHGAHVEDAIEWLEENDKPRKGTIYAEHSPSDIEKFERAGWRAEPATKDIDAGIAEVRHRLEIDGHGRPGLVISDRPSTRPLIQEFLGYKEEHVGTSKAVDHGLDACRYLCMGESGAPGLGIIGADPDWVL